MKTFFLGLLLQSTALVCAFAQGTPPNLLQDSVHYRQYNNGQIAFVSSNKSHYDVDGVLLYRDDYTPGNAPTRTYHYYDASTGRQTEYITKSLINGQEVNLSRSTFGYDPQGRLMEQVYYTPGVSPGAWIAGTRALTEYLANDTISRTNQTFNGSWSNASRNLILEPLPGEEVNRLFSFAIWQNGAWVPFNEVRNTYNANGELEQHFSLNYNGGQLSSGFRRTYQNANGRATEVLQEQWNATTGTWEAQRIGQYAYDATNVLESITYYTPDGASVQSREVFVFGDGTYSSRPEQKITKFWDGQAFLDQYLSLSEYEMLTDGRVHLHAGEFTQQPAGSGTWVASFDYDVYYFVIQPSAVEDTAAATTCHCSYPNPYRAGQQALCEGLQSGQRYNLQVFDLTGRPVYARSFDGAEGWSIQQYLPSGLYVAVVTLDGQLMGSHKVVME